MPAPHRTTRWRGGGLMCPPGRWEKAFLLVNTPPILPNFGRCLASAVFNVSYTRRSGARGPISFAKTKTVNVSDDFLTCIQVTGDLILLADELSSVICQGVLEIESFNGALAPGAIFTSQAGRTHIKRRPRNRGNRLGHGTRSRHWRRVTSL